MNPSTNCPHCGAEEAEPITAWMRPRSYLCQSEIGIDEDWKRTPLCREREARQNAEANNQKLCEIIEDFYAWTRADHPTEADVRDLMNRYYDLLNNIQTK
jgi:hypothetical protein